MTPSGARSPRETEERFLAVAADGGPLLDPING
jgi:hypothetical protein